MIYLLLLLNISFAEANPCKEFVLLDQGRGELESYRVRINDCGKRGGKHRLDI